MPWCSWLSRVLDTDEVSGSTPDGISYLLPTPPPAVPIVTAQGNFSALHARPTVMDLHGENHYAQFARKHWMKAKKAPTVKSNVLKTELWDSLEKDGFAYGSLLILENLQILEK